MFMLGSNVPSESIKKNSRTLVYIGTILIQRYYAFSTITTLHITPKLRPIHIGPGLHLKGTGFSTQTAPSLLVAHW